MAKKQNEQNPLEKLTFEQAIEALGSIVQKIETGQVPLQESLRQYEQGMGLIQHCRKILLDAEKRIDMIHESQDSTAQTVLPEAEDGDNDDDGTTDESESTGDPEDDSLF